MNTNLSQSVCSRCGKTRVITSSHEEKIGNSVITVTETACPDHDCQAKVDSQLKKDRAKREEIKNNSEKRKSSWEKKKN